MIDSSVVEYSTIDELISKRNQEAKLILEIINLRKELDKINGNASTVFRKLEYVYRYEDEIESLRKVIDKGYWYDVLNKMQIEKLTTAEDKRKIFEKIEKETPAFNEKDVREYLANLVDSPQALASNMIKKVFESISQINFRAGNNWRGEKKQMNINGIEKSFRASLFGSAKSFSDFRYTTWRYGRGSDFLLDLERVCYLVDGKIQPDYSNNIIAILDNEITQGNDVANNTYFKVKLFLNGNVKIDFLNTEILDRINLWGSDGTGLKTKKV